MNDQTITNIVKEIAPSLVGRNFGKIFQLSKLTLAIDFRTGDGRYLLISVEPAQPRIHMIERRLRDLEKQSQASTPFTMVLRKHLGGARLLSLTKDEGDRIVRLSLMANDEVGNNVERKLILQLTGKAANILLLNEHDFIIDTLRPPRGEGQQVGEPYSLPPRPSREAQAKMILDQAGFDTLSAAADDYYRRLEADRALASHASTLRARLHKEVAQKQKLRTRLEQDLRAHGDADEHKRIGDLLLSNIGREHRAGNVITLTDYYSEDMPLVEVEVDENSTLQEEAARRFALYTKARRAAVEIKQRVAALEKELKVLLSRQTELESVIEKGDESALAEFDGPGQKQPLVIKGRPKTSDSVPGARRYRSSDGYEILVGRAARDNDHLTFKVARPYDLWLHAADYPGSHVIIRNPTRADIPHRTVIEAAQLAAAFSQARRDSKVDVHYTARKFLSKPKGAAPGLVRMSSFRSIAVEPLEAIERI